MLSCIFSSIFWKHVTRHSCLFLFLVMPQTKWREYFLEVVTCHYVPKALELDLSAFTFWYKLDSKQSSKVQSCSFWWYLSFDLYNGHISDWCEKACTKCSIYFSCDRIPICFTKRSFWYIWTCIVHIWRKGIIKAVSGLANAIFS